MSTSFIILLVRECENIHNLIQLSFNTVQHSEDGWKRLKWKLAKWPKSGLERKLNIYFFIQDKSSSVTVRSIDTIC
jgi:hypothetical protein